MRSRLHRVGTRGDQHGSSVVGTKERLLADVGARVHADQGRESKRGLSGLSLDPA